METVLSHCRGQGQTHHCWEGMEGILREYCSLFTLLEFIVQLMGQQQHPGVIHCGDICILSNLDVGASTLHLRKVFVYLSICLCLQNIIKAMSPFREKNELSFLADPYERLGICRCNGAALSCPLRLREQREMDANMNLMLLAMLLSLV